MNPPGTPIAYTLSAKPLGKRSRRKHATVQVTYIMGGEDIPTQEQARDIAWSYRALKDGALWDVLQERGRQVVDKGFDAAHDDKHDLGELASAACLLADPLTESLEGDEDDEELGWAVRLRAEIQNDRRRQLVIAASLIVAEIERLDRAAALNPPTR